MTAKLVQGYEVVIGFETHTQLSTQSKIFSRAAAVRSSVEQALMSAVPGLRATIQLLPSDVEAHFNEPRDLI